MNSNRNVVINWYESHWEPGFVRWWKGYETLGLHDGLYEKGTKNFAEALLNMNDLVGRLLELENKKTVKILDAGCGVGGTSIYLGNKFKNAHFTGITISPKQIEWATQFANERNFNNNTTFLLKNYMETGFPNEYFNGVFALESMDYAPNKRDFLKEINRVLKPGGKLIIIDPFIIKKIKNPIMEKIYNLYYEGRGAPIFTVFDDFKSYLELEGFYNIKVRDLSKNIIRSECRSFILSIPFVVSVLLKRLTKGKKYDYSKDIDYYLAVGFLSPFMGLSGTAAYYAVIATKE